MFPKMRRIKQSLTENEIISILEKGTSGVLALSGDDNYPYALPISYVYHNSKLYFHCAKTGHKLDAIRRNDKASFCVIEQDKIIPEKFTTYFRSVIVFGKIRIMEDEKEIRSAMSVLAEKYSPDESMQARINEIDKNSDRLTVLEFEIEHMTGKEAIELVKQRNKAGE